jgi:hypothetical protein
MALLGELALVIVELQEGKYCRGRSDVGKINPPPANLQTIRQEFWWQRETLTQWRIFWADSWAMIRCGIDSERMLRRTPANDLTCGVKPTLIST